MHVLVSMISFSLIGVKAIISDGQIDSINKGSRPLLVPRVEPPIIRPPRIIEPDPIQPIVPVDPIGSVDPILSGDPHDLSGPGDVSTVGDERPIASPDGTIDQTALFKYYQIPDVEHGGSPFPYDGLKEIPEDQAAGYTNPPTIFEGIFRNTVNYIKNLKDFEKLMGPDRSLFYSGFNAKARPDDTYRSYLFEARDLASDPKRPLTCWDGVLAQFRPRTDDELKNLGLKVVELELDLKISSAAFARQSSGDVRVILPDAGVPRRNTWTDFEWPELLTNEKVTRIIRVNPDTLEEQVIWTADRHLAYYPFEINRPMNTFPSY